MRKFHFCGILWISAMAVLYYVYSRPARSIPTIAEILTPIEYQIVEMNTRQPSFKLATSDGKKPYADGDRAQETVVNSLQLPDKCRRDPSLIVVDVGAFLGEFGLYAAACGCQVFFFEVQPNMVALIKKSIELNNFPTSRVQVIHRAVSDLPTGSHLTFQTAGGTTTISNGSLQVQSIRLDDVPWPAKGIILLMKVDVEGFELNVLQSAPNLFKENRIHHLIFEYTAWWTDRSSQKDLIMFVEKSLLARKIYALDRTGSSVYGPLEREALDQFYNDHLVRHLQTDVYAVLIDSNDNATLPIQPYVRHRSFA